MKMVKKLVGHTVLWLLGWHVEGGPPEHRKCIVVGHPHTSSWDFPLFVMTMWVMGVQMRWMGKQSLFNGPMGGLFLALGGLPVDRSGGKNTVQAVADLFAERETLMVGIAPSGTRQAGEHWKSGFYHIALAANVPLLLGCIDFKKRVGGFLGVLHLTGNVKTDMDNIRQAYEGIEGRNMERQIPIRLAEEAESHSPQNK
jgi:1-acyl-sn-glycerol-3-phosphate acyltransferase